MIDKLILFYFIFKIHVLSANFSYHLFTLWCFCYSLCCLPHNQQLLATDTVKATFHQDNLIPTTGICFLLIY